MGYVYKYAQDAYINLGILINSYICTLYKHLYQLLYWILNLSVFSYLYILLISVGDFIYFFYFQCHTATHQREIIQTSVTFSLVVLKREKGPGLSASLQTLRIPNHQKFE